MVKHLYSQFGPITVISDITTYLLIKHFGVSGLDGIFNFPLETVTPKHAFQQIKEAKFSIDHEGLLAKNLPLFDIAIVVVLNSREV